MTRGARGRFPLNLRLKLSNSSLLTALACTTITVSPQRVTTLFSVATRATGSQDQKIFWLPNAVANYHISK